MKTFLLLPATEKTNGILVKKTKNNINSCELRKISISGRDNGYISSINKSGAIVPQGLSWRGKLANSPIPIDDVRKLVEKNFTAILEIINE